jgi:hypothetical protein
VAGDPEESAFGASGFPRQELLHVGIAIRDFPIGSEPSISAGTRGERSRRVGVRDIGVSGVVKLLHN